MGTNNGFDKAKANTMDEVKIKEAKIPKFGAQNAPALQPQSKVESTVDVVQEKVTSSEGVGAAKPIEVKTGGTDKIVNQEGLADKQAKGKGSKTPLDELAKQLLLKMGVTPQDLERLESLDAEQRAQAIARISEQFTAALREEKGVEPRGERLQERGTVAASTNLGSAFVSGVASTGGALIGGIASLAGGSVRLAGAAAGVLGRKAATIGQGISSKRAQPFEGVSVLPTISEYRVKKVEEATRNYGNAVEAFWKVPPMAVMRKEIEARARQSGLSVPDAMERMKPGGEWSDLHDKFIKEIAAAPEAIQAKTAMDKALSSWVRQYDHGKEELLSADVEGNPNHKIAKKRIEATRELMESNAAETPIFAGESESHAQRLKAALGAIMERIHELLHAVGQRFSGARSDHAAP